MMQSPDLSFVAEDVSFVGNFTREFRVSAKRLYVIGNSHMDPVWLWRLREGRSTWLNTCRSVVAMLRRHAFLKFCRSSSAAYKWIEASDPELFADIRALVDEGRWELVGGWVEQSDTIVTPAESLLRQAVIGKAYFKEKFDRDVRIAYSVDAFGQNAGLPKILNTSGFDRYVWMRPSESEKKMPYLFKWRGDDGRSQVTCLRIRNGYCTGPWMKRKEDMFRHLDDLVAHGDEHQTFFFGVGDHGGGIYENQLEWLEAYRQNFDVVYSTLEEYFNVLDTLDLPVVEGEHTHHAPGCYTAVSGVKKWMARAERNLHKAEKMLTENLSITPEQRMDATLRLGDAWEALLFNYFHDVYPGTSTAASYDEEVRDDLGLANKTAVDILETGLSCYASQMKTDFLKEGGVLVWNPLPYAVRARVWVDVFTDPNGTGGAFDALTDANGETMPLQWLRAASTCQPNGGWGRMSMVVDLAPSDLRAFAYGRTTNPETRQLGFARQHAWLKRLSFDVLKDEGDTWGHALKRLGPTLGSAVCEAVEEMENGPVCSRLRARFAWKNSRVALDLFAWHGIDDIEARVFGDWREAREDLKLVLGTDAVAGEILSGQSGCVIAREADGCEQPFIDWVAVQHADEISGFIVEAIHGYDSEGLQKLRLTVNRPVVYADHAPFPPNGDEGMADIGAIEQRFWLFNFRGNAEALPRLARERIFGVEHYEITAARDGKSFQRDTWEVEPACVDVLSQRLGNAGLAFDLLNTSGRDTPFRFLRNGREVGAGVLKPYELRQMELP